jgi:hypothetical protein
VYLSAVSLQGVRGLETTLHDGPSSIGVDVLERTAFDLSGDASGQNEIEIFLEAAGVNPERVHRGIS